MGYRRIAVGIDFSPESEVAARRALDVARHSGGDLTLVHMCQTPDAAPSVPGAIASSYAQYSELVAQELADDRRRLESMCERLRDDEVAVEHLVRDGFADTGLCEAAAEVGADLVCVGTHGRSGLEKLLLGSVAQRVVRLCETDVLVAREGGASAGGFRRILVASDFSPAADEALAKAAELAASGAEIVVVHVIDDVPLGRRLSGDDEALRDLTSALADSVRDQGEELCGRIRRGDLSVRFDVEVGAPRTRIAELAGRDDCDLVAMGSQGARGARRLLLGSVAESTVQRAPCSVLIAH